MAISSHDIIIVGAGIAGVSAAWALADSARVLVLERESQPGFHATGRSAAYFAPAYGNAVVRQLTAASSNFYFSPPAGFTDVPLLHPRRGLFIGRQDQAESIGAMVTENPSLQRIDGAALAAQVPILNLDVIRQGLLDDAGGDLDVDAILQGFLKGSRLKGGELITGTAIRDITRKSGTWHLDCGNREFAAPVLVNAAGAWADQLAQAAGVGPLGLIPRRRTALLVDAPAGQDITHWPLVIDVDEQFYFKPDAGQILVSPADETPSPACDAQADELDVAIAVDRLMAATSIEVRRVNHRWAGLRTFAADKTFVVGFDPRAEGFFWLAGQGGYGVQSAPGVAQLARDLLLESAPPPSLAPVIDLVAPGRFLR